MAAKRHLSLQRHVQQVTSVLGMVALAALVVLSVQHVLTPTQIAAQAGRAQGIRASALRAVAQQAAPSDRAVVITSEFTALNNGDLDGAVTLFASNAVFVGAARANGACTQAAPCTDLAGIRQQLQDHVVGDHACLTLRSLTVSGAVVTGQRQDQSDTSRKNGIANGDIEDFMALIPGSQITFFAALKNVGDPDTATDLAISAGTQPAGTPIPNPSTPCGTS